jgi:hypothetical protein
VVPCAVGSVLDLTIRIRPVPSGLGRDVLEVELRQLGPAGKQVATEQQQREVPDLPQARLGDGGEDLAGRRFI